MTAYAIQLENGTDTAARMRVAHLLTLAPGDDPLTADGGLRPDGGGGVSVNDGTLTVDVEPFIALVPGGVSLVQGGYTFVSDDTETLTVDAGHATLTRVDTVVARVRENALDASGFTDAAVVLIKGTAGAGAPTLPTNSIPLRNINVHATASVGTGGLTSSNLGTDRRTYVRPISGANELAVNRFIVNTFTMTLPAGDVLSDSTERTALQGSFTKQSAATKLIVDVNGTFEHTHDAGSPGPPVLGLRIDGTNYDIAVAPDVDGIRVLAGTRSLAGVAAGTLTVEPIVKTSGTLSFESGHSLSYSVREVPAFA